MFDQIIQNATLVDGSGAERRIVDIGILNSKIAEIAPPGSLSDGLDIFDATGLVVTPGIIDPHTHYDAQVFWDPHVSNSLEHGVTTVISGNCGFTLAPLQPQDAAYTRELMASVEGMSVAALEEGVPWNWESFEQFLERLEGNVGVNIGFLVGHCALRRYVMGDKAVGNEASAQEVNEMRNLLAQSIDAGGLGFSTTLSRTHSDGDGQPVASRWATHDELLALCEEVGKHEGTTLEAMTDGCLDRFSDDEVELFGSMSAVASRPLNWNVLTIDSADPGRIPHQLAAADSAAAKGGKVVALTLPVQVPMNMSFGTHCGLFLIPGWDAVMKLPVPERMKALADPDTQTTMLALATSDSAGVFKRLADFDNYIIGDTFSAQNEGLKGRRVGDVAAERSTTTFAALIQIVIADELQTVLWPIPPDGDDASWELRRQTWDDPRAMLGGSDAGAHLDRMCGAPFATRFIADCLRGRKLVSLERAVQMMTQVPAELFGLSGRGTIVEGNWADLFIFDPTTVGADHATLVRDLPGDSIRLTATATGVRRVYVNGELAVCENEPTKTLAGTVLRSGRDTYTVATS